MNPSARRLALLLWLGSANAETFQYLYIEANEGNASGGHVAIQFADEVFHYQYSNGLTRLMLEDAQDFRFDYRFLQNRSLHVADIEVSSNVFADLQTHFKRQFWDQDRQFKQLQSLENDRLLLEWLKNVRNSPSPIPPPQPLSLPGAGLFSQEAQNGVSGPCDTRLASNSIMTELQNQIRMQDGPEFLEHKLAQLRTDIQRLSPASVIHSEYGFAQRHIDLLNGFMALQAIQTPSPLHAESCHALDATQWPLDDGKIQTLKNYRHHLLQTARRMLQSTRPDWGHALFVTLARLVVVEQSLSSGQWVFLDDFNADAPTLSTELYQRQETEMHTLQKKAEQQWQQYWQTFGAEKRLDDNAYTDLELAANRYSEWQVGLKLQQLRYQGQQALPDRSLPMPTATMPETSIQQLDEVLGAIQVKLSEKNAEIEQHYAYNLITRNCVTEIFRTMDQAMSPQTGRSLSDSLNTDFSFIPFIAFDRLKDHLTVRNSYILPSFRQLELDRLYAERFAPWIFIRESNVLSADLYHYNPDDAAFVFFTDNGLLLRPLFGAFNTLTGIGQSLLGLFKWPTDGGIALNNGTRGILMSLPELAFVNIRKGSYKFDFSTKPLE